jgi:hypothetical protein
LEGGEDFEEGGFAAAVGAQEAEDFSGGDLEGYVFQRGAVAVAETQVVYFDCWGGHFLSRTIRT